MFGGKKLDVLPRSKNGSYYIDMLEDIRTLSDIVRDAQKWKSDNGITPQQQNNNAGRGKPPPALGSPDKGEVDINVDEDSFM